MIFKLKAYFSSKHLHRLSEDLASCWNVYPLNDTLFEVDGIFWSSDDALIETLTFYDDYFLGLSLHKIW
jgi:hypothetical protein